MIDSKARLFRWFASRTGARWPVLLCILLAAPLLCCSARAQALGRDIPQFDVFVGFDGVITEADWFPVVCEVRNEGPTFNATFEFGDSSVGGGLVRQLPIELPTGTLKRFSFPMFTGMRYGSQYTATLRNEKGQVVAQLGNLQSRAHINWQSELLVAIPSSAAGMPAFPGDAARNFSAKPVAATGRMKAEMFPDNPLALGGMSSFYLNSQNAPDLKERQVEAILSWLHAGGHLIIGLDSIIDVTGVPWLKSLVPGELSSVRTLPIGASFDAWLHSSAAGDSGNGPLEFDDVYRNLRGEPSFNEASLRAIGISNPSGKVELAAAGTPLIVSSRQGRGKVTVLLFNPEQEPLRSWKLRPYFWARVAEVPGLLLQDKTPPNQGYTGIDGVIGAMVDSRQIRKLPVSALLGLLVVYLLVIGPFDQWWLKRINRQMLTWITFPCYVVLFSVLIYVIGYKLRAGESEWNELQFVDVIPKGNAAELHGTTYASIYSPVNASYDLGGKQRFAAMRGEYLGAVASGRSTEGRLLLTGDQYEARVNVPVWTSQGFVGEWIEDGPPPLSAALTKVAGGGWELKLTNHELPANAKVKIALEGRLHTVPTPERGQTSTTALPAEGGTRINDFVNSASARFYEVAAQRTQGFGSDDARFNLQPADASIAITLATYMDSNRGNQYGQYAGAFLTPGRLELSHLLRQGNALVLVWCEDYAPTAAMNQFQPRRTGRSSLLRLAVEMKN